MGFDGLQEETAFCTFIGVSLDKLKSPTHADTKSLSTNIFGDFRSLQRKNTSHRVTNEGTPMDNCRY